MALLLTPGSDVAAFMNDARHINQTYKNVMTTAGETLCQHQEALFEKLVLALMM